jgi:choline dehydrogenase
VGNRLQDQRVFHNVYALKTEANIMKPSVGALIWTHSQTAEPGDLDLHISCTHLIDQVAGPTGGAVVLGCAVTLPRSFGRLRLSSPVPRVAPHINYNFFDDENDLDRLMEAVRLSRKIGRIPPLSHLIDHEIAPGN